jgi:SAM-dependent methyltransferase
LDKIKYFIVKHIYADHNKSKAVKRTISRLVYEMKSGDRGINIGSGRTRIAPNILNMEIEIGEDIDIVGSVEDIPAGDNEFSLAICQEVLEHVADPSKALREIARVLRPGGHAYIQLPFTIGYHPCPQDYWRFSRDGIETLLRGSGLQLVESGVSVGPATGFYRIAVEFFAVFLSLPMKATYRPFKFLFALLLFPLKFLDVLAPFLPEADRIAGGFYVVGRK